MKRIISFSSILFIVFAMCISPITTYAEYGQAIPVPEFRSANIDLSDKVDYMGYGNGAELLHNSIFTDVTNHWAKRQITRMSAQSVIKGFGTKSFKPNNKISRQEVTALLVRMMGREGAVQQALNTTAAGTSSNFMNDAWAEGYVLEAVNQGILIGDEFVDFKAPISREEVAVWVARMLKLDPVFDNIEILYTFSDWRDITYQNIGLVEAVLQERVMKGSSGKFNPKASITRAEMATVLDNVSSRLYQERGIEAYYGQIMNIQRKNVNEIGGKLNATYITVKNLDGNVVTFKTATKASSVTNELVAYKNGIVSGANILAVGDEIEYLVRNEEVFFAEALNDGSVIGKIKEAVNDNSTYRTYYGTIQYISKEDQFSGPNNKKIERFRIRNIDGQEFDIVVDTDMDSGIKNDIIVHKGNTTGGSGLLKSFDEIEYVIKDNKTIEYVKVVDIQKETVYATVNLVDPDARSINVLDFNNNVKIYSVADYAPISINYREGSIADLRYGQNVTLNINNGWVTAVYAETNVDNPGYVQAGSKTRSGKIQYIFSDTITIEYTDKTTESYRLFDDTTIIKEDSRIRYKDLREGDKVKIYFDSLYSGNISKIQVEGDEQLLKNIYKGKIEKVDKSDYEITIKDPSVLRNGDWIDTDDYTLELDIDKYADVYFDGEDIGLDELKDEHKNDYIYIALEDSYGKDKAIKMVVKKNSEKIYKETIDDINFTAEKLELENGKNIKYTDGTIIIKNNRLVSEGALEEDLDAIIVVDYKSSSYTANVISIGDIGYKQFDNVYAGKIDSIDKDDFELNYYSELEANEWDDVSSKSSSTEEFDYGKDSYIVDVSDDEYEEIDEDDFFNDGYSDEDDEDYFAFVVTDNSKDVIGMVIRENELVKDSNANDDDEMEDVLKDLLLTRAKVDEIDLVRGRMRIYDSYDWSDFYEEWRSVEVDEYVDIEQVLVIKGKNAIDIDDVDEDDVVYIIRDDEDSIIIFVE